MVGNSWAVAGLDVSREGEVFGSIGRVCVPVIAIGHTRQNAPDSHPNSEVKLLQARVVLGRGTTREGRVLIAFLRFCPIHLPVTPTSHVRRPLAGSSAV